MSAFRRLLGARAMRDVADCERGWEAEAIQDGRLGPAGGQSYARHRRACGECELRFRELRRMGEFLQRATDTSSSPLDHRRRRARLLRAANDEILQRGHNPRFSRWRVGAALAVLAAGVFASPAMRSRADHVGRSAEEPRLVRTVDVTLRPPSPSAAQTTPLAVRETAALPALPDVFGHAMRLFQQGEYRAAETLLRRVRQDPGQDSHAEDAAFLRVVCFQRVDALAEARQAARAYLRRYPHGFRSPEARALAEAPED